MTKEIIDRSGKTVIVEDLPAEHPYAFDTRTVPHLHAIDGTIINLETKEQFNGKTKVKTMTDQEIRTEINKKPEEVI